MIKVGQMREKDFDAIVPKVSFNHMEEAKKNRVIELCLEAYKMKYDGDLKYSKDMAQHIK